MANNMNHARRMMRARAAGMARATAGRARTFDLNTEYDDSAEQIAEALEERQLQKEKDMQELAADYSSL
jgi:hypothetical protein